MITDYSTLCAAVADFLNRSDLTSVIPTFVQMAEAKFNRELRTQEMLTQYAFTATSEYKTAPADFLEAYSLDVVGTANLQQITFVAPDEMRAYKARPNYSGTAQTKYCSLIGSQFDLWPAPTSLSLNLIYYAKIPALTSTANWLLTKSPDVYLHGALVESAPYLKNDERLVTWGTLRQQEIDAINLESERAMRPRGQGVRANLRSFG